MSRIVKAYEVVDDRPKQAQSQGMDFSAIPILKKGAVPASTQRMSVQGMPAQSEYLDTLNRLKLQIEESKETLRKLNSQIELIQAGPICKSPHYDVKEDLDGSLQEARKEVEAARFQAEKLLEQAEQEAEQLRQQAKDEAQEIKEAAKSEGYLNGFNKGYEEATTEFKEKNQPRAKELEQLLDRLASFEEDLIHNFEKDLVRLVLVVAEKIIGEELTEDPQKILSMLYQVLESNRRQDWITITVAPDLLPISTKASEQVTKKIAEIAPSAKLIVDKDASDGTLVVETPSGITDVSVATQLETLQDTLINA